MGAISGREELFLLILLPASLFDMAWYRVPNALLVSGLLMSLVRHLEAQGLQGIFPWLTGAIVPFVLCYFFYRRRMLGASDSKFYSVIGSYAGAYLILKIMVVSLFTGAMIAFMKMLLNHNTVRRFRRLSNYVFCCMQEKRWTPYYDREKEGEDGIIPFTVAVSLAVILCVY